jgi:hypothetical protein
MLTLLRLSMLAAFIELFLDTRTNHLFLFSDGLAVMPARRLGMTRPAFE